MKEIGIEKNDAVFVVGNNHFPAVVFGEEFPDASGSLLVTGIIGGKPPVQGSFFLVYDQAPIGGI